MSKILKEFLSEVVERMDNENDQMFDITTILTKKQKEKIVVLIKMMLKVLQII